MKLSRAMHDNLNCVLILVTSLPTKLPTSIRIGIMSKRLQRGAIPRAFLFFISSSSSFFFLFSKMTNEISLKATRWKKRCFGVFRRGRGERRVASWGRKGHGRGGRENFRKIVASCDVEQDKERARLIEKICKTGGASPRHRLIRIRVSFGLWFRLRVVGCHQEATGKAERAREASGHGRERETNGEEGTKGRREERRVAREGSGGLEHSQSSD